MDSPRRTEEAFVFEADGIEYLKLCLAVTLYFVGSAFDHVEGILDCYEQSMSIIKNDVAQYETGTMSSPKRVKKDTFSLLAHWLKNPKTKQDILMLRLDNSRSPDGAADRGFMMDAVDEENAGALRLVLGTDFVDEAPSRLVDVAKSMVRKLDFSSGHGGFSLNWNNNGDMVAEAKAKIAVLSQRHPGIDIPDMDGDLYVVDEGIKCANWLTLLNQGYCDRVGGLDKLRKSMGKQVVVHDLPSGCLIQAGPRPEIGDVNRGSRLPLYRKVGAAVAPLRAKGHPPFIPSADEDATEKWLARFDS